jgi:hypothetical protein
VRTSIHPTKAPKAIDDDIGGNDKLTPFTELIWNGTIEI